MKKLWEIPFLEELHFGSIFNQGKGKGHNDHGNGKGKGHDDDHSHGHGHDWWHWGDDDGIDNDPILDS